MRAQFAEDAPLQELGIEGYAATTLNDAGGAPIGLLSVMSRRPLANAQLIEAMLKIFAARIASEIERRRAEQVLRASESQYRAMFDAAADALVLRDADYRVVDVNPAFLSATGFRREDLIGLDGLIVIPQELRERPVRAAQARDRRRADPVRGARDGPRRHARSTSRCAACR